MYLVVSNPDPCCLSYFKLVRMLLTGKLVGVESTFCFAYGTNCVADMSR